MRSIRVDGNYYVYFSVLSLKEQTINLSIVTNDMKNNLTENTDVLLKKGPHKYCVPFKMNLPKGYSDSTNENKYIKFKLGDLILTTKYLIDVLPPKYLHLDFLSQKCICDKLINDYSLFRKNKNSNIILLTGKSGMGKSYIIDKFLLSQFNKTGTFYHISFGNDIFENDKLIVSLISFLYYPYLHIDELENTYLTKLDQEDSLNPNLKSLLQNIDNPEELHNKFKSFSKDKSFFNNNLHLNERLIILDDIQKLNSDSLMFLLTLIKELQKCDEKCAIFIILVGWPNINEQIKQKHNDLKLTRYNLELKNDDIKNILESTNIFAFNSNTKISERQLKILFPSTIQLISFFEI